MSLNKNLVPLKEDLRLVAVLTLIGWLLFFFNVRIPHTEAYIEGRWIAGFIGFALLGRLWCCVLLAALISVPLGANYPFIIGITGNLFYAIPFMLLIRATYLRLIRHIRNDFLFAGAFFLVILIGYQLTTMPLLWALVSFIEGGTFLDGMLKGWREQPFLVESILVGIISAASLTAIRANRRLRQNQRRIEHINRILLAIRNVNQLITQEKDTARLLQHACELLTGNSGIYSAWIIQMRDGQPEGPHYFSSAEGKTLDGVKCLQSADIPRCAARALETDGIARIDDSFDYCPNCPLVNNQPARRGLSIALKHEGACYGWLSISVPAAAIHDPEELALFDELAEDIAFALWSHDTRSEREYLREQFSAVLNTTSDAIISCSPEGTITLFNHGAEHLFECPAADALGTSISRFCPDELKEEQARYLEELRQEDAVRTYETERVSATGKRVPVEISLSAHRDSQGRPLALHGIIRDISERKRHEQQLIDAKETAEAANRTKDEFLAIMSHELRTPITPIIGFASIMLNETTNAQHREYLDTMLQSSDKLVALIQDVLDFSRLQKKGVEPQLAYIQPLQLLNEIVGKTRRQHTNCQFSLVDGNPPAISPVDTAIAVETDEGMIKQIVDKLLSNACKFTEHGEISIRIGFAGAPNTAENKQRLRIEVQDTGVGIPANKQNVIFDPFSQADTSFSRPYGGMGLGLAICKRLVEILDGQITVESEVGIGSCFAIELPVATRTETQPHMRETRTGEPALKLTGNPRILVAEDQPDNQMFLKACLRHFEAAPQIVSNGQEALEELASKAYDLVIMDLSMPVIDGIEATRLIRSGAVRGSDNIPILALTAHENTESHQKATEAGIDAFIAKPVSPATLAQAINQMLEQATLPQTKQNTSLHIES